MKPILPALSAPWLMAGVLLSAGTAGAQQSSAPVITVKPAVVVSMPTEPGMVYQMQASADLQSWSPVGKPILSTGSPIEQPVATASQQFFRLQIVDGSNHGPAPASIEGHNLQFNEGSRVVLVNFSPNGNGTWRSGATTQLFQWIWERTSLTEGKAELSLPNGKREVLQLSYAVPQAGRFTRLVYQDNQMVDTDGGSFGPQQVQSTTTTIVPAVPLTLAGRSIVFSDLPTSGSLTIGPNSSGTRQMDGTSKAFSGNWLITGATSARLLANFSPTHGEEYRFTFMTPNCGRYSRQTFTEGLFRDSDEGTFSLTNP
jgi:hypothetical protein